MSSPASDIAKVVPWGRTSEEYRRMFVLGGEDLGRRLLGVGDGPASFNAEWSAAGGDVVSVDPVYVHPGPAIASRFDDAASVVHAMVAREHHRFLWNDIASPDEMVARRRRALDGFLAHYRHPESAGRYVAGSVPILPFRADSFDLVLCSHLLFLYSHVLDAAMHEAALRDMLRVAPELRVFPLLDMDGMRSAHLGPVTCALEASGHRVAIERVPYEFQRGACEMLRVLRRRRVMPHRTIQRSGPVPSGGTSPALAARMTNWNRPTSDGSLSAPSSFPVWT